jgi:hypothetical protein
MRSGVRVQRSVSGLSRSRTPVWPDVVPKTTLKGLELPASGHPLVSIIVPTYGKLAVTAACLRSIARHPPRAPIEEVRGGDARRLPHSGGHGPARFDDSDGVDIN